MLSLLPYLLLFVLVAFALVRVEAANEAAAKLKQNVDHIVIFMQENRAFDHYYGTLQGVRGFNDRVSIPMRNKMPSSFYQPIGSGADEVMLPFRVNKDKTSAMCMDAPEMDYECDMKIIDKGLFDSWNTARDPGFGMSFWTREDLPYYYKLCDNFLIGDQYYQSTFTCTNPNRLHLFSASNGLSVGQDAVLDNTEPRPGFNWITVAEQLQAINVTWKVYQQMDNFDDNGFAWFEAFQKARPGDALFENGLVRSVSLLDEFEKDLTNKALPQVSWIVGPTSKSEHATNHPSAGEDLTANILARLKSYPDIYARTVFILNYDEGGQFFDHAWTPVPPIGPNGGVSSVPTTGEVNNNVMTTVPAPIGLGFRVPLLVVSPFTRGNLVSSQVLDHTSVVQLLEKRFDFTSPNISPWRRLVAGDMLSCFNFDKPDYTWPSDLPDTSDYVRQGDIECKTLPPPEIPSVQSMPEQETGVRTSRALPYVFTVTDSYDQADGSFEVSIDGAASPAGAAFIVYDELALDSESPTRQYAVAAGSTVRDSFPSTSTPSNSSDGDISYAYSLFGPNGFCRQFSARQGNDKLGAQASLSYDVVKLQVVLELTCSQSSATPISFAIRDNAYGLLQNEVVDVIVQPGQTNSFRVSLASSQQWYDISVSATSTNQANSASSAGFYRRFVGRMETGLDTTSDPAMSAHIAPISNARQGLYGIYLAMLDAPVAPLAEKYTKPVRKMEGTHKDATYFKRGGEEL